MDNEAPLWIIISPHKKWRREQRGPSTFLQLYCIKADSRTCPEDLAVFLSNRLYSESYSFFLRPTQDSILICPTMASYRDQLLLTSECFLSPVRNSPPNYCPQYRLAFPFIDSSSISIQCMLSILLQHHISKFPMYSPWSFPDCPYFFFFSEKNFF